MLRPIPKLVTVGVLVVRQTGLQDEARSGASFEDPLYGAPISFSMQVFALVFFHNSRKADDKSAPDRLLRAKACSVRVVVQFGPSSVVKVDRRAIM